MLQVSDRGMQEGQSRLRFQVANRVVSRIDQARHKQGKSTTIESLATVARKIDIVRSIRSAKAAASLAVASSTAASASRQQSPARVPASHTGAAA